MPYIERTDEEITAVMDKKRISEPGRLRFTVRKITPSISSIDTRGVDEFEVRLMLVKMTREYCKKIDEDPIKYLNPTGDT